MPEKCPSTTQLRKLRKSACDLLKSPVNDVAVNEPVGGFKDLDGQPRVLGKDTELAVDDDHSVRPFDYILDFEPQLRGALKATPIEVANGRLAARTPVGTRLRDQNRRAQEDRVVGVVAHQQIEVARIPSLK